jgi:protein O-mannosyl-transferase
MAKRRQRPPTRNSPQRAGSPDGASGARIPEAGRFRARWRQHGRLWLILLGLVAGTLAIYWQVSRFEFINFDDPLFVSADAMVQAGLSWPGVVYAFSHQLCGEWVPLTCLSHMLVAQLFGLHPGAHHLANVGLHLANALLLFFVLKRMTGRLWCSAIVAALFAWHPLRVESVAWVSERKDVLCGLFWLLTLWAYLRYAAQPGWARYLLTMVFFILGLMAKAILVTLPFVLLLLDCWPLGRLEPGSWFVVRGSSSPRPPDDPASHLRLLLEKVPLLVCAGLWVLITFLGQKADESVASLTALSLPDRLANAVISYARYLGKTFVPIDLAVLYPHPGHWGFWKVLPAGLLLGLVSLAVWRWRRSQPWWLVGWCWFVGTLVPVIGLVQLGRQAMADRFTYLPQIGLWIALVWGLAELARSRPWLWLQKGASALAAGSLAVCVGLAWQQTGHWRDSVTLFRHALEATVNNGVAHNQLGLALQGAAQWDEAESHFREAVRLLPGYLLAQGNLGLLHLARGQIEEAFQELHRLAREHPREFYFRANLAQVQWLRGRTREAMAEWREALRLRPETPAVLSNLAWVLATHPEAQFRDGPESLQLAHRACELTAFKGVREMATLAAALAENGRFGEAVEAQQRALALAQRERPDLAAPIEQTLQLYQQGRPFREPAR